MKETIIISGISGFIGTALSQYLLSKNYAIKGLIRNKQHIEKLKTIGVESILWDGLTPNQWVEQIEGAIAIVNLSGENIASGRWSKNKKKKILESRINAGKTLTEALTQLKHKPKVFIQASAIGYYGPNDNEDLKEDASKGVGFLAKIAKEWEQSTFAVEKIGIRRNICRLGMVLGKNGGALPRIILPFRYFIGGPMGTGKQWMSWIHIEDVVKGIEFLIAQEKNHGIYNFTAPNPIRNFEFSKILGNLLHRPSFFSIPAIILRLVLGEMANELLLNGQRVLPARLSENGFNFCYPYLKPALDNILKGSP